MGEHTALIMSCELKRDTPQQVIETLEFIVNPDKYDAKEELFNPPTHPLFQTEVWEIILKTRGGRLWDVGSTLTYNQDTNTYTLNVRTSVKDHDNQVVSFLHWIAPYSQTEGFVGTSHPEYQNEECRILFEKGHAFLVNPVENSAGLYEVEESRNKHLKQLSESISVMINNNPDLQTMFNDPGYIRILNAQLERIKHDNPEFIQMLNNNPNLKDFKKILDKATGKTTDEAPPE